VTEAEEIWRTDPNTLQDVILDRPAVEARLGECPPLERVWILSLLGRHDEAVKEGHQLLARSQDRFKPLLVLAHAYQRQYRWAEAGPSRNRRSAWPSPGPGKRWSVTTSAGASSTKHGTGMQQRSSNGPVTCTGRAAAPAWQRRPGRRPCAPGRCTRKGAGRDGADGPLAQV
jgi:hypothetical protein